jgi:hypothetical protein
VTAVLVKLALILSESVSANAIIPEPEMALGNSKILLVLNFKVPAVCIATADEDDNVPPAALIKSSSVPAEMVVAPVYV